MASRLTWLSRELGVHTLRHSSPSVFIIILNRFFRMFAYGGFNFIIAIYFKALGFSDTKIGLFLTLTLLGEVSVGLFLTPFADGFGRRRALRIEAWMMIASGIVFAISQNFWILLLGAVLSPNGNKIGPFRAVEEAALAQLSTLHGRSDVYAFYMLATSLSIAFGHLVYGWTVNRMKAFGFTIVEAYQSTFVIYAVIGLLKVVLLLKLGVDCEMVEPKKAHLIIGEETEPLVEQSPETTERESSLKKTSILSQLSPASRLILFKLCLLFSVDMLASGLTPGSLITYFVESKFDPDIGVLGSALTLAWLISAVSNIFSSAIAKRIGYVRAMVFTHLPGSIILGLLPVAPNFAALVVLLFIRASVDCMDLAPKSAFLSSVVLPGERTAIMGITNIVKTLAQSAGPLITGVLAGKQLFWVAFAIAGSLKVAYDLSLLIMFSGTATLDGLERVSNQYDSDED